MIMFYWILLAVWCFFTSCAKIPPSSKELLDRFDEQIKSSIETTIKTSIPDDLWDSDKIKNSRQIIHNAAKRALQLYCEDERDRLILDNFLTCTKEIKSTSPDEKLLRYDICRHDTENTTESCNLELESLNREIKWQIQLAMGSSSIQN